MEFISLAIKKQKHMGLQKKECSNTPIHPLMTSSDFLVLITILLAIVSTAIANNNLDLQIQQIFYHNIHSYNDSNQLFHLFSVVWAKRNIHWTPHDKRKPHGCYMGVYTITCFHFSVDMENSNLQTFSFFKQSQVNQLL